MPRPSTHMRLPFGSAPRMPARVATSNGEEEDEEEGVAREDVWSVPGPSLARPGSWGRTSPGRRTVADISKESKVSTWLRAGDAACLLAEKAVVGKPKLSPRLTLGKNRHGLCLNPVWELVWECQASRSRAPLRRPSASIHPFLRLFSLPKLSTLTRWHQRSRPPQPRARLVHALRAGEGGRQALVFAGPSRLPLPSAFPTRLPFR